MTRGDLEKLIIEKDGMAYIAWEYVDEIEHKITEARVILNNLEGDVY